MICRFGFFLYKHTQKEQTAIWHRLKDPEFKNWRLCETMNEVGQTFRSVGSNVKQAGQTFGLVGRKDIENNINMSCTQMQY